MKIALFSTKNYDREYFGKFSHPDIEEITFFESFLNERTVQMTRGYDAVCVFVNDHVNREVLTQLKNNGVTVVALRCAGFNNVDLIAAKELGIKILRVPAYSPSAVAEHALALILTLNRKTHKAFNRIREGNFSLERLVGFNLDGKTVGVVGTGKIGQVFCRIMQGFGCKVLAYDLYPNEELKKKGVEYLALDELFSRSDIISLHCPLTRDTRHMINRAAFQQMKEGVMIINTSRGALLNTKDALQALTDRKLGYLGIDVYEQEEKLFFKDLSEYIIDDELIMRLISYPNVLITAHQAFFTREALDQITRVTMQNLIDYKKGIPLVNEVLPHQD